jgi:opacity protein-like surface antigen
MRFKLASTVALFLVFSALNVDSAAAQQTINFSVGAFSLRGQDARVDGDVLVANRRDFVFDFDDFRSPSLAAEWLVPIGDYVEAGAGIGFARRTVPTIYDDFVRPDVTEIDQEIKLRTVPFSATVRILPLGRNGRFQPYVGGGIGVTSWRYSETGDYIDFTQSGRPIFNASYSATGTTVGPIAVFGARVPMGNVAVGGEIRYQRAEADLDERDFLGPKLDLGGFHYVATFGIRF